jgi:hypothetical protein
LAERSILVNIQEATTGFTLILYFWKSFAFLNKMSSVVIQDEKFVECSYHQATTSTAICKLFDQKPSSHAQDSEIMGISSFHLQDHNYCGTGESEV